MRGPIEEFVDSITRGNTTEVKTLLASVVVVLAVYQVALISVGYGKVRVPFLAARPASRAHRASGDAIVVIAVCIAVMCIGAYGFEEDGTHIACALALFFVIGLKVVVLRWWTSLSWALPVLGTLVLVLFALTWLTSAAGVLADA